MGQILEFPQRHASQLADRVRSSLPLEITWDLPGTPDEEFRAGFEHGRETAHDRIRDRAEIARIAAARARGRIPFLDALRSSAFLKADGASNCTLEQLEHYLFGALSGGTHGPYGAGYFAGLLAASAGEH